MADESEESGYELCIMRHGIAVDRGAHSSSSDAKRPLTPEGKDRMKEIARGLAKAGFSAEWIVSSPFTRAAETAEIVAESMKSQVPFDHCEALEPGGSAEALLAFLAQHSERKSVLLVGHEPGLSELAARFTGAGRHANLAFKKGGCCLISFRQSPPTPPGRLKWWLTPRLLRKLV